MHASCQEDGTLWVFFADAKGRQRQFMTVCHCDRCVESVEHAVAENVETMPSHAGEDGGESPTRLVESGGRK